jgi:hypothetical protein
MCLFQNAMLRYVCVPFSKSDTRMFLRAFFKKRLETTREADEVRANTESSTLAGCDGNTGRERVEKRERGEGGNTDRGYLTERRLLGVEDKYRDERDNETLDRVLEY